GSPAAKGRTVHRPADVRRVGVGVDEKAGGQGLCVHRRVVADGRGVAGGRHRGQGRRRRARGVRAAVRAGGEREGATGEESAEGARASLSRRDQGTIHRPRSFWIMSLVEALAQNAAAIRDRIAAACARAGRDPREVELIWVSKTHPVETLVAAHEAGAHLFGENRVQEVLEKFPLPAHEDGSARDYELHLIGSLQRNKVRKVLPLVTTIHSVDSPELWETLNRIAGELGVRRRVLVQVNTSREPNKGGVGPDALMDFIAALPAAPP